MLKCMNFVTFNALKIILSKTERNNKQARFLGNNLRNTNLLYYFQKLHEKRATTTTTGSGPISPP